MLLLLFRATPTAPSVPLVFSSCTLILLMALHYLKQCYYFLLLRATPTAPSMPPGFSSCTLTCCIAPHVSSAAAFPHCCYSGPLLFGIFHASRLLKRHPYCAHGTHCLKHCYCFWLLRATPMAPSMPPGSSSCTHTLISLPYLKCNCCKYYCCSGSLLWHLPCLPTPQAAPPL